MGTFPVLVGMLIYHFMGGDQGAEKGLNDTLFN